MADSPLPEASTERASVTPTLGLLPLLAISAAVSGPVPALAQTAVDLDPVTIQGIDGSTEARTGYGLTDSTSKKVLTPLAETPKSVTVITQKQIQDRGATSLTEVLRTTPGITLGAAEGGSNALGDRPTIRGFEAGQDMLVDGLRSVARTSHESFNLESIEITKGPDGATAGRGATGGSINLGTKKPVDDEFTDVALTFGTGAFKRATLDTNRTIGDLGLRLNVMAQGADDLSGRKGVSSERYGIAPSLSYQFQDGSKLTASLYYYENHDLPDYGLSMENSGYLTGNWGPIKGQKNTAWFGLKDKDYRDVVSKSALFQYERDLGAGFSWSSSLRFSHDTNEYVGTKGLLTSATPIATRRNVSSNKESEAVVFNSQITGETSYFGAEHKLAFGIDISREVNRSRRMTVDGALPDGDLYNPNPDDPWSGTVTVGPILNEGTTNSVGIYAVDVISLAPKWDLSLGLRYDSYRVDFEDFQNNRFIENDSAFFNGSIGLLYKLNDQTSIYGRFASSANPSSDAAGIDNSNNPTLATKDLDPERSYSYELGAKWVNASSTFMLSGALFVTDKTNARQQVDSDGNYDLIGKTRAKGVELGFAGQVTDKLNLSGGYTYTDAEQVKTGYSNAGFGVNDGKKVANIVPHSFSIWGTYDYSQAISLGLGASYNSKRFVNSANTYEVPGTWQVDAMASYKFDNGATVRLNVLNLFDETIYTSAHTAGWEQVNVGPARTVMVTLAKSF